MNVLQIFSNPMVGTLQEFGERIRVPSFYVTFVLIPFALHAPTMLEIVDYARRKTPKVIILKRMTLFSDVEISCIIRYCCSTLAEYRYRCKRLLSAELKWCL